MKSATLKVSFIIPVCNLPAEMIRECVESITALSLGEQEREIIMVDDGSEVSPVNELADLRDGLIYLRQRNKGQSAARNLGLSIATGDYIQFVDGDDKLVAAPYEHCLDIVRYQRPDVVMFNSGQQKGRRDVPYEYAPPMSGSDYMRRHNLRSAAWGYIFSRLTLGNLRFDETLRSHEDEDFTPRLLLRAESLVETSANAYYYRPRKGSIMHNFERKHIDGRLENMEIVLLRLRDMAAVVPDHDKPALRRRVAQLTMDYLYNIIRLRRSTEQLEATVQRLRGKGLFPLPDKDYTRKYQLFRHLMNSRLLRTMAVHLLP